MSEYYRYLNIENTFFDKEVLMGKYIPPDLNKNKQWRIEGADLSIINDTWFKQNGCTIQVAELFYTAPHSKIKWHIDISGYSPLFDYVKINIVWGAEESHYMQWGEMIDEKCVSEIGYNSAGSPHMIFEPEQIEMTESVTIDKPILVNVGVPHRAVNDSDLGRWCISLIPKKNNNRIAFKQAIKLFHEHL
jgi:hypothetical protein